MLLHVITDDVPLRAARRACCVCGGQCVTYRLARSSASSIFSSSASLRYSSKGPNSRASRKSRHTPSNGRGPSASRSRSVASACCLRTDRGSDLSGNVNEPVVTSPPVRRLRVAGGSVSSRTSSVCGSSTMGSGSLVCANCCSSCETSASSSEAHLKIFPVPNRPSSSAARRWFRSCSRTACATSALPSAGRPMSRANDWANSSGVSGDVRSHSRRSRSTYRSICTSYWSVNQETHLYNHAQVVLGIDMCKCIRRTLFFTLFCFLRARVASLP